MEYTNYNTYWYKYQKDGKTYKVSNFYVDSSTYNSSMIHLSFEQALRTNKSELIEG